MALLNKLMARWRAPSPQPQPQPAAAPLRVDDWIARGNAALEGWQLAEAGACYREALALAPGDARATLNLGFVLLEQGSVAEAEGLLARVPGLLPQGDPLAADASFLRGRALRALGRVDEALAAFDVAAQRPGFLDPQEEALQLVQAEGRNEEALVRAQRLHAARGSDASAMTLAQALCEAGRPAEALPLLDAVLARAADHAGAWSGRGQALLELDRAEDALACFEQAARLAGESPALLTNAATALGRLGRRDEALDRLARIVERWPDDAHAALNQALLLLEALRPREAAAAARRALAHHPQDADLHWALAVACLLQGDFAEGWQEHEWRWQAGPFRRNREAAPGRAPAWAPGEDLRNRTLLVFAEQGLGDAIQFLRYLPWLAQRASTVLLQLPPALHRLVQGTQLPPNCVLLASASQAPAWDREIALLSLPFAAGTTAASVPADVPYLRAEPALVQRWRDRLDAAGPGLKVGVAWSGNPRHANDRNRSVPLATFEAVAQDGCRFVSLLPQVRDSDRAALAAWDGLLPWGEELRDFAETAALVEALDLVITVDTSVAHLAGALGRPVWILLPHVPDWRWMLGRDDSPWYPSARLWRQARAGDWDEVIGRVRRELGEAAARGTAG